MHSLERALVVKTNKSLSAEPELCTGHRVVRAGHVQDSIANQRGHRGAIAWEITLTIVPVDDQVTFAFTTCWMDRRVLVAGVRPTDGHFI